MKFSVPDRTIAVSCGVVFMLIGAGTFQLPAQSNQSVYADSLQNGWQNWSWATVNLTNPSPVHAGVFSISVSSSNWQALYLHHAAQDASQFTSLAFWINGGSAGGQSGQGQGARQRTGQSGAQLAAPP